MSGARIHASRRPSLAYERRGRGPTLLLLHGYGHDRRAWEPVMERLAGERDVIAVDMPGFGDSPWPRGSAFGWNSLVAHLGAFIESLDLDRPHVAGNSLGGLAALELAKQGWANSVTVMSPAAFSSLTGNAYVLGVIGTCQALATALPDDAWRRMFAVPGLRNLLLLGAFGHPSNVSTEAAVGMISSLRRSPMVATALPRLAGYRIRNGDRIAVPVTIAWGTRDFVLRPYQVRTARKLLPDARLVPLPGCGHVPMSDDPDLVAKVLLSGSASVVSSPDRAAR